MCMRYEKEYKKRCFDYLFFEGWDGDESLVDVLEKYDVEIVDKKKFQLAFFEMLEKFHREGVIHPMKKDKGE